MLLLRGVKPVRTAVDPVCLNSFGWVTAILLPSINAADAKSFGFRSCHGATGPLTTTAPNMALTSP
ncbi:MAG: hypothetical protein NDI67_10175 [Sulfuritalea sp.]|nr:hypothetical protein [Sulfuritalea sp.]